MAAVPYCISNPKGNNVLLRVERSGPAGRTLALLRPGETFQADQPQVTVTAVPLPAKLVQLPDGTVRLDTRATPPRLRAGRSPGNSNPTLDG